MLSPDFRSSKLSWQLTEDDTAAFYIGFVDLERGEWSSPDDDS